MLCVGVDFTLSDEREGQVGLSTKGDILPVFDLDALFSTLASAQHNRVDDRGARE